MPHLHFRSAGLLLLALLLVLCGPAAAVNQATKQFHALLADHWQWQSREFPEQATFNGNNRYNDRLTDASAAAVVRRKLAQTEFLARLKRIDARQLATQDQVSYAVFAAERTQQARLNAIYGKLPFGAEDGWLPVSQMHGPHLDLAELAKASPFNSVADYEAYLKRLAALPTAIDQVIERMRQGMASGWMPPAIAIQRVPRQIAAHLDADARKSPAYRPFEKFPAQFSSEERLQLAENGRRVIVGAVTPAFEKLKAFVEEKYLPAARQQLSASTLPGGGAYYQLMIAQHTTTTMGAREIHEIGLSEVARINAAMETEIRRSGFQGSRAEFIKYINTDPRFLFTRPEDMLTVYRDIAKRADAELSRLFAELPRLPYGIRAMEAYEGDNAEHYTPGNSESGRAGYFEANVLNLKRRSMPSMQALLLHEAVPGHHLQIARQQEIKGLPAFRRFGWFTAFGEGWALYAESLGTEMGFYQDPYSKFGQLSMEMHRACRLVIDTGLHAFGWSREHAIAYLETNAALSNEFATAEVDRYIVWPGQALSYKIGELRIKALRAKAQTALGARFDLRRFHNAVIDNGVLPLDVLEQQIDRWIAAEQQGS